MKLSSANPSDYCIIITSTDSRENAEAIIRTLLEQKLAACIQSSNIQSAYRWQGKIISGEEIRLEIKSRVSLYPQLKETIGQVHIYEVPEILMIPVADANEAYLKWISEETVPLTTHSESKQSPESNREEVEV